MKKNKKQSRNEFRKHKPSGHPAYIYHKVGKEFKYIGITHAPISRGIKNIPLEQNPNPEDNEKTYAKPKPEKDKDSHFGNLLCGWTLNQKDKEIVQKISKKK